MASLRKSLKINLSIAGLTFFFNEFLIYEIYSYSCHWHYAEKNRSSESEKCTKIMFIADPHLLGPFRGHWFDKLRREWQMQRSFQSTFWKLIPDYVFVLGDLYDEGELVDDAEWNYYLERFHGRIFYMDDQEKLKIVVGNHDIGFHHTILYDGGKWERFKLTYNIQSSVELFNVTSNLMFVTINSMALKQDYGCDLCDEAILKISKLPDKLNNLGKEGICECKMKDGKVDCRTSGKPVILQHFPLYRKNELACLGLPDGPSPKVASIRNRESWDVLSEDSTKFLLEKVEPCLVISGHTHHGCFMDHHSIYELSVPSFSWRNINNPSITLGVFTTENIYINKCYLPKESTVFTIYFVSIAMLSLFNLRQGIQYLRKARTKPKST